MDSVWRIEYSQSALRALRRMPRNVEATIKSKIFALAADPYAPNNNATKLQGRSGYRLRVGDWRVVYELEVKRISVLVMEITPRGGAYQ
jgi:mRNA interferase RelE/StbE